MNTNTHQDRMDALLENYVSAYKSIHAKSCFSPEELDVVLLSMFFEKGCLYCIDAHRSISERMPDSDMEKERQLKEDALILEAKQRALSAFSRSVASRKGYSKEDIEQFFSSGHSEKQLLCVIAIHGILTWNNFFSPIYEEPLRELIKDRVMSIADIKTLEIVSLAS